MARYSFERATGGQPRTFVVEHHPLTDRLTVERDGAQLPVTLRRKPFSSLWRYAFVSDGEALEVRVRPEGLRGLSVSLHAATEPLAKKGLSGLTLAGVVAGGFCFSLFVLPGPLGVSAVIGLFASLGAAALLGVVSRRA